MTVVSGPEARALDKQIARLALPALAALAAEPLLLLADSAIIGHLGTAPLAGLAVAASLLSLVTGLCIFLAYAGTGTVARRLGAGQHREALAGGIDSMALGLLLGVVLATALQIVAVSAVQAYGAPPDAAAEALSYLRVALLGLPSLLLLLAATGVLRGLQDTRTPLYVVIAANVVNVALTLSLVYGLRMGIAGAALGTVIAQTGAAIAATWVVVRRARAAGAPLRFRPGGVVTAARIGGWLIVRTATLVTAVTLTTVVAASGGLSVLAAHQVVASLWILLAFALDAIAIAAQAIIGRALGAGEVQLGRAMMRRMLGWGALCGLVFGIALLTLRPLYVGIFTPDPEVQASIARALVVVAVLTPLAGVVYVLDGVLIGAGDGRYLAWAGLLSLLAYAPFALLVGNRGAGLAWLWAAYGVFMAARLVTLALRARGGAWLRVGSGLHPSA